MRPPDRGRRPGHAAREVKLLLTTRERYGSPDSGAKTIPYVFQQTEIRVIALVGVLGVEDGGFG